LSSTQSFQHARVSTALFVLAGVLWGTGGLAGAMLQDAAGLGPVAVAAYRLLIGGGLATLVVGRRLGQLRGNGSRVVLSGLLLAQFQAAYQVGVALIGVSFSTLLTIGVVPVLVTTVTAVREGRVPSRQTFVAVGGSVLGLGFLCGGPAEIEGWRVVGGVGASLFAGVGFGVLTLVVARPLVGQHVVTSAGLLLGGLFLLPFGLVSGMSFPVDGRVLGILTFLGTVPTALAYGAYFLGLRGGRATAAALAAMLEPLTATLLSVSIYGERLGGSGTLGALLIAVALGVYYLG
jgi:DME family drug/metabolite transporter